MLRQRSWLLSMLLLSPCGSLGGAIASAQTIEFVDGSGASVSTQLEGGRARVRIVDSGLNFYPSVPDLVGVTFSSAATGDQDQVVFQETGPSTGVFVGGIDPSAARPVSMVCSPPRRVPARFDARHDRGALSAPRRELSVGHRHGRPVGHDADRRARQ